MQCSSSGSSVRSRSSTDGAPVPLGGRNQRALLTLLLLRANEAVSTERLVDQLWGEHPPRTATTSLQNAVSQLRKLLGPGLAAHAAAGYLLELDGEPARPGPLRAARPRGARCRAGRSARVLLREALALWRGPALADSELEDFAQAEIHRLEDLRLGVLEDRIAADLELGRRRRARRRARGARPSASAARAAARRS